MDKIFYSSSDRDTEEIGAKIAFALEKSGIRRAYISLVGELGSGKTAFSRGFSEYLGHSGVRSPTYTVVNEYTSGRIPVFHFDLYRLEDEDDLYSTGYDDYFARDGYILCEWSDKIPGAAPDDAIDVRFVKKGDCDREIYVSGLPVGENENI